MVRTFDEIFMNNTPNSSSFFDRAVPYFLVELVIILDILALVHSILGKQRENFYTMWIIINM